MGSIKIEIVIAAVEVLARKYVITCRSTDMQTPNEFYPPLAIPRNLTASQRKVLKIPSTPVRERAEKLSGFICTQYTTQRQLVDSASIFGFTPRRQPDHSNTLAGG